MKNSKEFPFHFIRHTNAEYKSEKRILESEDPEKLLLNARDQITPDLSEKGKEYAAEKAKEFFKRFNPEKDVFVFLVVMKLEQSKQLIFIGKWRTNSDFKF